MRVMHVAKAVVVLACLSAGSGRAAGEGVDVAAAAAALAASYPGALSRALPDAVVWHDGTVMRLGEVRRPGEIANIMRAPSLAEQFMFVYPTSRWSVANLPADDPGRVRNQDFFIKMYGDCRRGSVQRRLRRVVWLPKTAAQALWVTSVNGIDRIVVKISSEIEALPRAERLAATQLSGGFACRNIAGTVQLSMHSYGAALDLRVSVGRYWRWSGTSPPGRAKQFVPQDIIEIFERNGFIWGGKWFHVDGIHFEYRPELIEYVRRSARPNAIEPSDAKLIDGGAAVP